MEDVNIFRVIFFSVNVHEQVYISALTVSVEVSLAIVREQMSEKRMLAHL